MTTKDTTSIKYLQQFANLHDIEISDNEASDIVGKICDDLTKYSPADMNALISDYANLRIKEWFKQSEQEDTEELE